MRSSSGIQMVLEKRPLSSGKVTVAAVSVWRAALKRRQLTGCDTAAGWLQVAVVPRRWRSQTDRRDNGLPLRLFHRSSGRRPELHHACLPQPLKSRLALVQSNYHPLLHLFLLSLPSLSSPSVLSHVLPSLSFPALSVRGFRVHYANSGTS